MSQTTNLKTSVKVPVVKDTFQNREKVTSMHLTVRLHLKVDLCLGQLKQYNVFYMDFCITLCTVMQLKAAVSSLWHALQK